jgi:acetylornithine deacetylase/succinyl-diaminopimelate desuccinylase-like protein
VSILDSVLKRIDENEAKDVKSTQEYLRQPSVSHTGEGIEETAELTASILRELGATDVGLLKFKDGHPVVHGRLDSKGGRGRILVYNMYDVQPVEPIGAWTRGPWDADIVDGKIIARGAVNSKGPLMAFLNSVRSIQEVDSLPVNLTFLIEGEEELESPHLSEALDILSEDISKADSVYMQATTQTPVTRYKPVVWLGSKGQVDFEFEVANGSKEVHSQWSNWIDNPIWRLIWAMNSMRGVDDEVSVEGFYDGIVPPSREDVEVMERLLPVLDVESVKASFGLQHIRKDLSGMEMLEELFFRPNPINLSGVNAGYTGPGIRGAVPASVKAKAEVRIVPHMTPEKVASSIRVHLEKHGFGDVKVTSLEGYPAAKTDPSSPIARACLLALERLGFEPLAFPMTPGGAPVYLFQSKFGLPMAFSGLGYNDLAHVPNEYITVQQLIQSEKLAASTLYEYARLVGEPRTGKTSAPPG